MDESKPLRIPRHIEIEVEYQPSLRAFSVWLFKAGAENAGLVEPVEPDIEISDDAAMVLFTKLGEAIRRDGREPVPEKRFVEGQLEAQTKHLNDLRAMLELPNSGVPDA
jgi:hypothetical protein